MKTLLLIDANSLIHRAFHALPPLTKKDGTPTQALYGVSSILLKLWREGKPDYAAACFDRPEPTFRKEKFPAYKAQRPKAPDELVSQLIAAHDLFPAFGVRAFELPGWEADDLIATLAEKFGGRRGIRVVVLTGDLDSLQLVKGGSVVVRTLQKGVSQTTIYDEAAVAARYGLPPRSLPDYKALIGDQSDNVPGVPGVGPKTAAALLSAHGSLEGVLRAAEKDASVKKKIGGFAGQARLAKELVTLDRQAPLEAGGLEDLKVPEGLDSARVYFESMGFEGLLRRLVGSPSAAAAKAAAEKKEKNRPAGGYGAGSLFGNLPAPGKRPESARPPAEPKPKAEGAVFVEGKIEPKEGRSGDLKVGFDLKKALKRAWEEQGDILPPYFDLGVALWLLDPDAKDYGPEAACRRLLNRGFEGEADLADLYREARERLESSGLSRVFGEIEMPLVRVLAEMEHRGIMVSKERLEKLRKSVSKIVSGLEAEIRRSAGADFNVNSPKAVGEVLFEVIGLRGGKKTKGGRLSTRAEALESLKGEHPVVPLILEYREAAKLESTYIEPLLAGPAGGAVHTDYVQTGTSTGRLSSQNPNLQNIPKGTAWADELRSAFVPRPGFSFLACDYSQLQLRIVASLSGDAAMARAFREGKDIHRLTAARVLGVPADSVTQNERRLAKTLNFGLLYGMGARAFARASGIAESDAKRFISAYFSEFASVKAWQERVIAEAEERGYTETLLGRRRYLPGLRSPAPYVRAEAERAAVNHPVQGLEADIVKLSMIKVRRDIEESGAWQKSARMILTIHDELLLEVPDGMMEKIARRVRASMESAFPLDVPLAADASAGPDWGHMSPLDLS